MDQLSADAASLSSFIAQASEEAKKYLANLEVLPAHEGRLEEVLESFTGNLPEEGVGAEATLNKLWSEGIKGLIHSTGKNTYHFVTGGSTPAAMASEWYTAIVDQPSFAWTSSPLGVTLESLAIKWLLELFELPSSWKGIMVTGATMANYTCLMAARQWCGEKNGVDISEVGINNTPPIPVISSGFIHASSKKCLSMMGLGRSALTTFEKDETGALDELAMESFLKTLDGKPAIIIANAGEVNTGAFDNIELLADLAHHYGCWLHVDGAFGLFARVSPKTRHLTKGVERAHSVTVDGHKWLNVPYDSGYAFVSQPELLVKAFHYSADYLPDPNDIKPNYGSMGPESSRRARGIAVWATLMAYGKKGHQKIVENCIENAKHMAALLGELPHFELLAEVPLNIVCFRYNPGSKSEEELNSLNQKLADEIFTDGRIYAGPTKYKGMTCLRPAMVNWRIDEESVKRFVAVVDELSGKL